MPETKPKVINGLSFDISQPYIEGHVLSAIEAGVLNQTRSENIGNNTRVKIKEMQEAGESDDAIRAHVTAFDADYQFRTASEGRGTSRDPYETEARKIARELLKAHLAQTGRKLSAAPNGETVDSWKDKVDGQIDKLASQPNVLAAAKKAVDAKRKQSETLLASLSEVEV